MVIRLGSNEQEFRLHRPSAQCVYLVGDFNGWHPTSLPMTREGRGDWVCRLHLPDGVYQFRYLVDGEWFTDFAAFGIEHCPFGHNSVWIVGNTELCGIPA